MKRRSLILFISGLLVALAAAAYQRVPGYMDADYYFSGGLEIAAGRGFQEWTLWNYLDSPAGLPNPSHAYWMPAASLIAAAGLLLSPESGFDGAQWGFILLSALIAPLTAALADSLYRERPPEFRRRAALTAGLLALFPGYYLGFLTTTDSFGLYMVLGAVFFLITASQRRMDAPKAVALGVVAGLMHLARADGFLWLAAAVFVVWRTRSQRRLLFEPAAGYGLVMAPWFVRNIQVFGSLLAPGGSRAFWLTRYEDLFAFPAEILTPARWLASGLPAIAGGILSAGWLNLQSAVAVGGIVFLFPLWVLGFVRRRRTVVVQAGLLAWFAIFLLMSVVFPFAGARGGYFHAAAAVQPLLWALVPDGLDGFVRWGQRARGWRSAEARRVFGAGLIVIAALTTALLGWTRVVQPGMRAESAPSAYQAAAGRLDGLDGGSASIVMVNNPPGFYLASGRPAIVIPDGGTRPILQAAAFYDAGYLVLGAEQGLDELYEEPAGHPGLRYLGEVSGLKIFAFGELP